LRILAVPNWSFCEPDLESKIVSLLSAYGHTVHYVQGDIDHQRTVTAFSGSPEAIFDAMNALCELVLPLINLAQANGVHPRSGALDVAPFVLLQGDNEALISQTRAWAESLWLAHQVPSYFYEQAALPGDEFRLPVLRGQVGTLPERFSVGEIPHPAWGYAVVGVRPFLLAANLTFASEHDAQVREAARLIRQRREQGDPAFLGVRALRFWLNSRGLSQLSLNLTRPDQTSFDAIFEWLVKQGLLPAETELIGVIRRGDLPNSTKLSVNPAQIVD
jgi:glutamate formiminotransferase